MDNQNEELYQKWDKWIDELGDQIINLFLQRRIYDGVREVVRNNSRIHEPSDFFFWLSVWYSSSMAVAIRRQADNREDSISYRRLLEGIKDHPAIISRTRFKQKFVDGNYQEFLADRNFDCYAGAGREHIDPEAMKKEIDELEAKTASIKHYVNKRVAHHDKKEFKEIPRYSDLDDAIDCLARLHRRYYEIFRCYEFGDFLPPFGYDWKSVFHYPWLS